ncbi:hypothetical protein DFH09DRAFT_1318020 [Mycena vulgaris]|nr:hypothetical protein DFH09DRAFT_1318020 [Mycena vulgaris]
MQALLTPHQTDPPFATSSHYLAPESEPFNLDSSSFPSLRLPPPQPSSPSELSSVFDDFRPQISPPLAPYPSLSALDVPSAPVHPGAYPRRTPPLGLYIVHPPSRDNDERPITQRLPDAHCLPSPEYPLLSTPPRPAPPHMLLLAQRHTPLQDRGCGYREPCAEEVPCLRALQSGDTATVDSRYWRAHAQEEWAGAPWERGYAVSLSILRIGAHTGSIGGQAVDGRQSGAVRREPEAKGAEAGRGGVRGKGGAAAAASEREGPQRAEEPELDSRALSDGSRRGKS